MTLTEHISNFCNLTHFSASEHLNQILSDWIEHRTGNCSAAYHGNHSSDQRRAPVPGSRTNPTSCAPRDKTASKLQLLTPPPSTWRLAANLLLHQCATAKHMRWMLQIAINHSQHLPFRCHPRIPLVSPACWRRITLSWDTQVSVRSLIPRCGLDYCHLQLAHSHPYLHLATR